MAQSWLLAGPKAMAVRSAHGFPLTRTKTPQFCRRPHRQGSAGWWEQGKRVDGAHRLQCEMGHEVVYIGGTI